MTKRNKNQIKVCRASGLPVNLKDQDLYKEHYQRLYDRVMAKYKIGETDILSPEFSQKLEKLFLRIQRILGKKYPNIRYWNYISSKLQWRMKVKEHGPITIAQDRETKDIVYVILDVDFPG